ncbi:MAG: CinA family protein [Chthoniobacterales bacterium]|nr:CinA family protein [Chthoniobacterales bacterium]
MIEETIVNTLRSRSQSVATAESCTGGLLAHRLTNVPGASAVFQQGLVVYSNQAKGELLGVPQKLLERFGAVSAEVATAMAERLRQKSGATFGLATTGIAGPAGGSAAKPIGTVFLAIASENKTTEVWREFFLGERLLFKEKATEALLQRFQIALLNKSTTQLKLS